MGMGYSLMTMPRSDRDSLASACNVVTLASNLRAAPFRMAPRRMTTPDCADSLALTAPDEHRDGCAAKLLGALDRGFRQRLVFPGFAHQHHAERKIRFRSRQRHNLAAPLVVQLMQDKLGKVRPH